MTVTSASRYEVPGMYPLRLKLNARTLSLAAIIFITTLSSSRHLYLIAAPILTFCWILFTDGASRAGLADIRFNRTVNLLCILVGVVLTAKAFSAVVAGATSVTGAVTVATFINRWIGDMLWLALFFLMISVFMNTSRQVLRGAIRLALAVHVVGFLSQIIVHYLFGYLLDFSGWLGGQPAKVGYLTYFRPTGFFTEPSNFAGAMILLLACDALVSRRISVRLTFLVAALNILSFSTAAWIFSAFLLLIVLPIVVRKTLVSVLIVAALIVIAGWSAQSEYMQVQIKKFGASSHLRTGVISYALTERPAWENLFGPASNGVSLEFYSKTGSFIGGANRLAAVSDDGTAVYLFVLYGVAGLGTYVAFFCYAYRRLMLPIFLLLFLATLTKHTPAFITFTVLAGAVCLELFPTRGGGMVGKSEGGLVPYGV